MGDATDKPIRALVVDGILRWENPKGGKQEIALTDARARSLVVTLINGATAILDAENGSAREKAVAEEALYSRLERDWLNPPDGNLPQAAEVNSSGSHTNCEAWILEEVQAEGLGGINAFNATVPFILGINDGAACFLGGNGSGKSSLISAVAWALTGQRINDSNGLSDFSNSLFPVFDGEYPETEIGRWAPIATYPLERSGYTKNAVVSVTLTFRKTGTEERTKLTRTWNSTHAPNTQTIWPQELEGLKQCLDVAVEMPLRMAHLRLGESGTLNDAISQLTGMDILTHAGNLVTSLKLKTGKFLNTPKQIDHDNQRKDIEREFDRAEKAKPHYRLELLALRGLANWATKPDEYFTTLKGLIDRIVGEVGTDLATLKEFVSPAMDLDKENSQAIVSTAAAAAANAYDTNHLKDQIATSCPLLAALSGMPEPARVAQACQDFSEKAEQALLGLVAIHKRNLTDLKLALKAQAATTHKKLHGDAPVNDCPLCNRTFEGTELLNLGNEIADLKQDADKITQTLAASSNLLVSSLEVELAASLGPLRSQTEKEPISSIGAELRRLLIGAQSFSATLPVFGALFDKKWTDCTATTIPEFKRDEHTQPSELAGFSSHDQAQIDRVWSLVIAAKNAKSLVEWASVGIPAIRTFYGALLGATPDPGNAPDRKTFRGICSVLSKAVNESRPGREAAEALQHVDGLAKRWLPNERTKRTRGEIVKAIEPLKDLPKYVEAEIARQLSGMSDRIREIAVRFHQAAPFAFRGARLEREPRRRKGFLRARAIPRGDSEPSGSREYEIDATLVANTSWMRSLLWAFLFAIREDRSNQLGGLPLPLMLMDDPQSTFDSEHQCAWIEYVLDPTSTSHISPAAQALFATHDESFARQIDMQIRDFPVRHIAPAPSATDSLFVNGLMLIDRVWAIAKNKRTNLSCMDAISEMRKHLEAMIKVIFPPAMGAQTTTLGELMDEFSGRINAKDFPYNQAEFRKLVEAWKDPKKEKYRKALSVPHHELKPVYDYNFALDLMNWCLSILYPAFRNAFAIIWRVQKAGWALPHSDALAGFAARPVVAEGWSMPMPANLDEIVGRVAAETDGRSAENFGEPGLRLIIGKFGKSKPPKLVNICMVAAPTLEPVAQIGDLLLLSADLPATQNSLVVCEAIGFARARRYSELSGTTGSVALVANAANPREIRKSIIVGAHPSGFQKVVGVIFRSGWKIPPPSEAEVAPFSETTTVQTLLEQSEGLVKVDGQSAEPIALHGQCLILGKAFSEKRTLDRFDGKPIVVIKDNEAVVKRLRLTTKAIILESLEINGRYRPIVLDVDEGTGAVEFRPVLGVLFDSDCE